MTQGVVVITKLCYLSQGGAGVEVTQATLGEIFQSTPGKSIPDTSHIDEGPQGRIHKPRGITSTEQLTTLKVQAFDFSVLCVYEEVVVTLITAKGMVIKASTDDSHGGTWVFG